ncbi:MAG TPA: hypothetical protein VGN20_19470 [Mucilaginibacter sp.]|jgi:hypothetical protein
MIQKTLKTIGSKLTIRIPTLLNEVTLGQMTAMQEIPDLNDLDAISVLSGIPIEELHNVRNISDFDVFQDPVQSLSHQIKHLYNSDAVPAKVNFYSDEGDSEVNVMSNLSVEPSGAFMAAREIIAEEINKHIERYGEADWKENFNPSLKSCCQILAHYFFCRVTKKRYNEYEAEEFINKIKKLRVTEALPIAKHFFTSYPSLSKQKTSFWLLFRLNWRERLGLSHSRSLNI